VTTLEVKKGIQDVPLHLVGQMLKLWEYKWATENENEIVTRSHKSWQQILQNESFLWKGIHLISKLLLDNFWATKKWYMLWNFVSSHFSPIKIDTWRQKLENNIYCLME
jgi:hypothetical protein